MIIKTSELELGSFLIQWLIWYQAQFNTTPFNINIQSRYYLHVGHIKLVGGKEIIRHRNACIILTLFQNKVYIIPAFLESQTIFFLKPKVKLFHAWQKL
jgi:hypothetical protein